jgi:alpha-tubulin suppressor-like RCC1 family protein
MGHIWKGFATTVFAVLTAICLVLFGYDNSVASTVTGTVWAWGYNDYGELGNGSTTSDPTPTPVQASGLNNVIAVSGGYFHSLALESNGTVWAWGFNGDGELGDGSTNTSAVPVQVSGLSGVIAVAAGRWTQPCRAGGQRFWRHPSRLLGGAIHRRHL